MRITNAEFSRIIATLDLDAGRAAEVASFDNETRKRWAVLFTALMRGINSKVISVDDLPPKPGRGADIVTQQAFLADLNSLLTDRGLLPV